MAVHTVGVYRIGLYDTLDAPTPAYSFPLPVIKANPLLGQSLSRGNRL